MVTIKCKFLRYLKMLNYTAKLEKKDQFFANEVAVHLSPFLSYNISYCEYILVPNDCSGS